jgi:hypothetical protein
MGELLPRVAHLCRLARGCGIGLNIDAEEADRGCSAESLIEMPGPSCRPRPPAARPIARIAPS